MAMIRQVLQRENVLEAPYPRIIRIRILSTHQFPVQGRNRIIDHSLVQISAPVKVHFGAEVMHQRFWISAISTGVSVHNAVVDRTYCHRYAILPRRAGYQRRPLF